MPLGQLDQEKLLISPCHSQFQEPNRKLSMFWRRSFSLCNRTKVLYRQGISFLFLIREKEEWNLLLLATVNQ